MKFTILTLFPDIIEGFMRSSIMARAVQKGLVSYEIVNIRDFAPGKHRNTDDTPYGGGAGMVFKPEPLAGALESVGARDKRVVYPSPSGKLFGQQVAEELSKEAELVLICGRYEGIDQRIIDSYVDDELSIGDYVISSGEIASLVIVDAVYRLVEGVISGESLAEESFGDGLLEYPHYTRPEIFNNMAIPEVLLSGHHEKIRTWRLRKKLEKTMKNRPELLDREAMPADLLRILDEIGNSEERG